MSLNTDIRNRKRPDLVKQWIRLTLGSLDQVVHKFYQLKQKLKLIKQIKNEKTIDILMESYCDQLKRTNISMIRQLEILESAAEIKQHTTLHSMRLEDNAWELLNLI